MEGNHRQRGSPVVMAVRAKHAAQDSAVCLVSKGGAMARQRIPRSIMLEVLTEAGYRCAVPTCRTILAIDLHHLVQVADGGGNTLANLLALCPTCHGLFHRGTIARESLYSWKSLLVSLSRAFDIEPLDHLLFLARPEVGDLRISGDAVLKFSRLIAADLAEFSLVMQNGPLLLYAVRLTSKGRMLVKAWKSGNREAVQNALGSPDDSSEGRKT